MLFYSHIDCNYIYIAVLVSGMSSLSSYSSPPEVLYYFYYGCMSDKKIVLPNAVTVVRWVYCATCQR